MRFSDISIVEAEIKRFQQRLDEFRKAQYESGHNDVTKDGRLRPGLKQNGSLKRSANDLKRELTRITQGKFWE